MKNHTENNSGRQSRGKTLLLTAVLVILIALTMVFILARSRAERPGTAAAPGTETAESAGPSGPETTLLELGSGIRIVGCGNYAGLYVEDGSDDIISNIPVVTVENDGSDMVQLMNFSIVMDSGTSYEFELTTLLPGQKMTVLEKNRAAYEEGTIASGTVNNYAVFSEAPSLHTDVLRLTYADDVLTVTNVSEQTIPTGRVFYKNMSGDLLIGGITYTASFPELEPGAEVSLSAAHFTEGGSCVLFVTYAE